MEVPRLNHLMMLANYTGIVVTPEQVLARYEAAGPRRYGTR